MSFILSFLTGPGGLYAILAAAIGAAAIWMRRDARKDERNKQRAKEAYAYEKHLKEITDAGNARPGGLPVDDPYNRDRG